MDSQYEKMMSKIFNNRSEYKISSFRNNFDNLTWDSIIWKTSYNKVRAIQKRIFKASSFNQMKRLYFLQKLLLQNPHAKIICVQKITNLKPYLNLISSEEKIQLAEKLKLDGKGISLNLHHMFPKMIQPISKDEKIFHFPRKEIEDLKRNKMFINEKKNKQTSNTKQHTLNNEKINFSDLKFFSSIIFETNKKTIMLNSSSKKKIFEIIQDKAKQFLCVLALEPQWEAKFEPYSYGNRPGRNQYDIINGISKHLNFNVDKYVFSMNLRSSLSSLNHDSFFLKFKSFPLMKFQIKAWLKIGILCEYRFQFLSILAPLLVNIIFHGLEENLFNYFSEVVKTIKNQEKLVIFRYTHRIILIHKNKDIIKSLVTELINWLSKYGLVISEKNCICKLASQSFEFLGFQINSYPDIKNSNRTKNNNNTKRFRVKVIPSKRKVLELISETRKIIQKNKAVSAYKLIELLKPIILNWGNYFKFCDCKDTFLKVDNIIFQQLRAWVFRRAIKQGRKKVKEKYFPRNQKIKFQGRTYNVNWILHGSKKTNADYLTTIYLPKLSWIQRKNWIKVKENFSIYNSNDEIYWCKRKSLQFKEIH